MFAIDNPLLLTILLAGAIYQQCLEETTLTLNSDIRMIT